jgi:hypothetical protein
MNNFFGAKLLPFGRFFLHNKPTYGAGIKQDENL